VGMKRNSTRRTLLQAEVLVAPFSFLANWLLFTDGLVQRGYKYDEIRKIIGENMMRVCRESLA